MDNRQYMLLRHAHFFDVKIKEGDREITVSGSNQRLVMQCLAEYLGQNELCWPSQLEISKWCSFITPEQLEQANSTGKQPSLRTAKRVIKALEENHYIEVDRVKIGDGRKTQNRYRIAWSNVAGINNQQTEIDFDGEYQSATNDDQSATNDDQSATDQYQSATEADQSATRGTQKPQPETPPRNPNNKPHLGEEDFDQERQRWERSLVAADRRAQLLVDKFQLRTREDLKNAQAFCSDLDTDEGTGRAFDRAIVETNLFIKQKQIPAGHRRLAAFRKIFGRVFEEVVCS